MSATPIEAPTSRRRPFQKNGRLNITTVCCSTCAIRAAFVGACRMIANSSPPSRATRPALWNARPRRCATSHRHASPAGWPSLSLRSLKRSRSIRTSAGREAMVQAVADDLAITGLENQTIGEPGERIGFGLPPQALQGLPVGRDVLFGAEDSRRPSAFNHRIDRKAHPASLAAPGPDLGIERYRAATADHLGTGEFHAAPGLVGIESDDVGAPQRVADRIAEDVVDARSPGQALRLEFTFPGADASEI